MLSTKAVKVLPWGEEIYMEISLNNKSRNRLYARHGKNVEGKDFVEFIKFGPKSDTENEHYLQKLRLYHPTQWAKIKYSIERELANSIGWDITQAEKEYKAELAEAEKSERVEAAAKN